MEKESLNCTEIEQAVRERTNMPLKTVKEVLHAYHAILFQALVKGVRVRLGNLGKLGVVQRMARPWHDVNAREIKLHAPYKRVKLNTSRHLQSVLNGQEEGL